jgi:hypothetical protein
MAAGEKIFSIGLMKTGTATLRTALNMLGLNVTNVDKNLWRDIEAGRLDGLWNFVGTRAEPVFRGWPLPTAYRQIFERYGNDARFIMTVRRDSDAWVRSLKKHVIRRGPMSNFKNIRAFGRMYPHGQERHYAAWYDRQLDEVHAFFRERGAEDRLLQICWEDGDGWEKLCSFLGRPIPATPFPYENRTADLGGRRLNEMVNAMIIAGYQRVRGE